MDRDPSIAVAAVPMSIVSKLERGDLSVTDVQRCLALPLSSEAFTLNASSPNSASSTTSSSMPERFISPGLIRHSSIHSENDGGDSTSAISTTAGRHDHPPDGGRTSSASNLPSPIIQEGPAMSTNEVWVDHMSEDIDVDVKPSLDEAYFSDTCRQDSSSDDMFMSRLNELLQSETPQDFVADSGFAGVDDLFPTFNGAGQDFCLLDGMNTWSTESLNALPFPEQDVAHAESLTFDGDESAAQMFTQWLRNNAHWISLSDLRKIKLKTSTIESATRRLGGGKRGLMLFLKLVLVWVQNSQMKRVALAEQTQSNGFLSLAMSSRPSTAPGHPGTSAVPMESVSVRDRLGPFDSSSAMQSRSLHVRTPSDYGSPSAHMAVNSSSSDWASRARWRQSPPVEQNSTFPTSNRFSSVTNSKAGSPLPSPTTFGHSNSTWPTHGNMLHGAPPSSMPPSLRSAAGGGNIGGAGVGDPATMMMLMQQQPCSESNPAATTRAARKSRMERQRWSVRRNRKWAAAAHQSQQRLGAAVLNGSMHNSLPAWPRAVGSTPSNLPYPNSRACQQRPSSKPAVMESQQNKKPERNLRLLFHKELKQSDVGNLGRIVLPKKAAETCLPPLDLRDGVNLVVEDMYSSKVWNMRYRFWPNNKSRMYLLENTGDFVKSYDLKEGDYMMLFRDSLTNRFVIRGAKGQGPAAAVLNGSMMGAENAREAGGVWNGAKKRKSLSKEDGDLMPRVPINPEESCDDSSFAELLEQALEDFKESSEAEICEPLVKPTVQ